MTIVIGVDPGLAKTGWGVIRFDSGSSHYMDSALSDKNKNEGQQQSSGFQRDYKNRGSNRSTGSNSSAILQEMQKQTSWQQKQIENKLFSSAKV